MKRLFFALWPDNETRLQIDKLNQAIHSVGLKKYKADNLHVTLVFLGNVDAEREVMIRQCMENIHAYPFSLTFNQLVYWRKPRILCLTAEQCDPQLLFLVDALKGELGSCGIAMEDRPYKPHVTLARKAQKQIELNFSAIRWFADSFSLVESLSTSEGVHYQVLQTWRME